jgi:heme-degrading monooxygenase HmoA
MERLTVDLADHPDLVVIYLGMRVRTLRGVRTLRSLGKQIERSAADRPDGLLRHEMLIYSLRPLHLGMRQYWRNFDAMERWTRSDPHRAWWKRYLKNTEGTGFWHETYLLRGGMEAVYIGMPDRVGMLSFAPAHPAVGQRHAARDRAGLPATPGQPFGRAG